MPLHDWKCPRCGAGVTVQRTVDEGGEGPTVAEVKEAGVQGCHEPAGHDWRKVYGAVLVTKGSNWGAGKGRW